MIKIANDSSGKLNKKVSKTEKLVIDKKYDTNWCDMPPELKLKCIGTMDFEIRYQLRQTARAENQLVDSMRYKFDQLYMKWDSFCLSRETSIDNDANSYTIPIVYSRRRFLSMKTVEVFRYALKHHDFNHYRFSNDELLERIDFSKFETVLVPKTIHYSLSDRDKIPDFNAMIQYFKCCCDKVENVTVAVASRSAFPLKELFALPSVFNAVQLIICSRGNPQSTEFIPLIQKWIEIDSQINTKLYFIGLIVRPSRLFDHFLGRVISREESEMRIKTDNPEKHILMHFSTGGFPYFCVTVVPSKIVES